MNPGDRVQDRYRLERKLGEGGMAEVWLAHDDRLERPVAIKFLDKHLAARPEFLVRFFSEAQAAAGVSHPGVVGILDFGREADSPYLVMEYMAGGTLADLTGEPIPPERAIDLVAQASAGAGALHAAGLVHRDVKPGNILLDANGHARLTDLGIADRDTGESLTGTGKTIGSPYYMAPERIGGKSAGPAADVYSLGVVLYELITGRRPFEGNSITSIAVAQVEQAPEPPSSHVPELAGEIDALVLRCLEKDPSRRFADGTELASALRSGRLLPAAIDTNRSETSGDAVEDASSPRMIAGALLISMLLTAAAVAVGFGGNEADVAEADALPGSSPAKPRPEPSPSSSRGATVPAAAPTPSPTPSPSPGRQEKEEEDREADERSPTPEEEETEAPSPSPATEPSPEPSTEAQDETD